MINVVVNECINEITHGYMIAIHTNARTNTSLTSLEYLQKAKRTINPHHIANNDYSTTGGKNIGKRSEFPRTPAPRSKTP
jgi:hypothetical protein